MPFFARHVVVVVCMCVCVCETMRVCEPALDYVWPLISNLGIPNQASNVHHSRGCPFRSGCAKTSFV